MMKKFLSFFGVFLFVSAPTVNVISCGKVEVIEIPQPVHTTIELTKTNVNLHQGAKNYNIADLISNRDKLDNLHFSLTNDKIAVGTTIDNVTGILSIDDNETIDTLNITISAKGADDCNLFVNILKPIDITIDNYFLYQPISSLLIVNFGIRGINITLPDNGDVQVLKIEKGSSGQRYDAKLTIRIWGKQDHMNLFTGNDGDGIYGHKYGAKFQFVELEPVYPNYMRSNSWYRANVYSYNPYALNVIDVKSSENKDPGYPY